MCLSNTGLEQIVVLQNQLNVVDWQVNEHTGDLGCFLTDQLGNEFVEHGSNLVLVVRVIWDDSRKDDVSGHHVLLVDGQCLLGNGLLLNLVIHLLHLHVLLLSRLSLHHHVLWLHSAHLLWLLLEHTVRSLVLPLVLSIVVPLLESAWSSVLHVSLSHWTSGSVLLLHQHWHAFDEELEVVLEFFLVGKVCPFSTL